MSIRSAIVILLLQSLTSPLFAQSYVFATHAGGPGNDYGTRVAVDKEDNIYVFGEFFGDATFDSITLHGAGTWNVFVAKYDPHGHVVWARMAGAANGAQSDILANGLAVDAAGNLFITGWFMSAARFGDSTYQCKGSTDIYLAKLNNTGHLLWMRQAGGVGQGTYGQDVAAGLALDAEGSCYIVGSYNTDAKFGDISLSSPNINEVFVAKYDSTGQALWATSGGAYSSSHLGMGIAVDGSGNSFITGSFFNKLSLGADTLDAIDAEKKMFAAKLDPKGVFVWAKKVGTGGYYGTSEHIAVDNKGNIFLAGYFRSSIQIGGNDFSYDFGYHYATLITKYDTAGTVKWVRRTEGANHQATSKQLAVDDQDNVYITGALSNATSFGSITTPTANSQSVAFISKLDSSGTFEFVKTIAAQGMAGGRGIAIMHSGDCVAVGSFDTAATLDSLHLKSAGKSDIYLVRLKGASGIPVEKGVEWQQSIYPNPVRQILRFGPAIYRGEIAIVDLSGSTMLLTTSRGPIDVSGLPPGTYFLNSPNKTSKFVKLGR